MEPTQEHAAAWIFCFGQSAKWWDSGRQSLLFRKKTRRPDGAFSIAIRTAPFSMDLPGPLQGVLDAPYGWQEHPAGRAAIKHYPFAKEVL